VTLRMKELESRVAASRVAVERAMGWYGGEVGNAREPPLSAPEFRELRDALLGAGGWRDEQFDHLMTFGRAMYRLAGQVPDCNVGDLLAVLAARPPRAEAAWSFEPGVDQEAFAKLAFRETSLGISGAQRENREGWWAHGQKNRAFIEQAAASCPQRARAVVFGAGRAFDLPLAPLARSFDRLVLVDIDGAALDETISSTFKDAGLRARVEARVMDLTGINGALVRRLDQILDGPGSAEEIETAVASLCRSYHLDRPPALLADGERPDLLVESCVLTQLAWPQRTYAERRYDQRFGPMPPARELRWSTAWAELGLRIQQDHIQALTGAAPLLVLTSDVVSHTTALDRSGQERPTGRDILPLGVHSLRERIPKAFVIGQHAAWVWNRYRASKRGEGSVMDVEGVELREPLTAGGLWLPPA
jgi:hypothetical protein